MQLSELLKELSQTEREQLADDAGTTVEYLYQIAGGHRGGSGKLIRLIAESGVNNGRTSKEEMRPDIFGEPNAA